MALRDDASDQGRVSAADKFNQFGIKGHKCGRSAIRGKDIGCSRQQPRIAVEVTLEFQEQSGSAGYQIEQFTECKNAVGGCLELNALELRHAQFGEAPRTLGQSTECIIVMHHGLAVGADLQICFDAVAASNRSCESGSSIFDDAALRVMQAAVSNGSCSQPIEGHWTITKPRTDLPPRRRH